MRELDEYEEQALEDYEAHLDQQSEAEADTDDYNDVGDTRESDWLSSGGRANYRGRRP